LHLSKQNPLSRSEDALQFQGKENKRNPPFGQIGVIQSTLPTSRVQGPWHEM